MSHFSNKNQRGNRDQNQGFRDKKNPDSGEKFPPAYNYAERFFDVWVKEKFTSESSQHAYDYAKYLADNRLTRTQLRNFFGELRRIEARGPAENAQAISFLRHKLAYTVSRLEEDKLPKAVARTFHGVLDKGLQALDGEPAALAERFERFTAYFEAVLAYHRFHGGRES